MHPTDTIHLRLPFIGQKFCVQHNDEQCKALARLWALLNCDTPWSARFFNFDLLLARDSHFPVITVSPFS
jgi:hypothetical protein